MGHARSTYPVLKALGVEAGDEGLDGRGNRLALLDGELPDWTSFIAANLLVDGVLTTFVAALRSTWEHAGRWMGPNDDEAMQAALSAGMIHRDAAFQREQMRAWLGELLEAEGVSLALDEPSDWSRWDAGRRRWNP
jgi:hypothetical protein